MRAILLPVKTLAHAKTRQAGFLTSLERVRVVKAMLFDVARAIRDSKASRVFLVSADPWALRYARRQGWDVFVEREQLSESASIDWASARLTEAGFTHALRLPADLPLIGFTDVDSLLDWEVATPGALIVPSRDGTGTNALLRSPPDLFPSRFGPDSLRLHLEEARRKGVQPVVIQNRRLSLDLDEPVDLEMFLRQGSGTATQRVLAEIGVAGRFARRSLGEGGPPE